MEEFPGPLHRLPPGRRMIPSEMVSAHQRQRIMDATAAVVAERGYRGMTIDHIIKAAGVAWGTFYETFPDPVEAFLATFDDTIEGARARLGDPDVAGLESWALQVCAAIRVLLEMAAQYPARAYLVIEEAPASGPDGLARHNEMVGELASKLREGRELETAEELRADTEEALVGGMLFTVAQRMALGDGKKLGELLPDLAEIALSPYIGVQKARKLAKDAGK